MALAQPRALMGICWVLVCLEAAGKAAIPATACTGTQWMDGHHLSNLLVSTVLCA